MSEFTEYVKEVLGSLGPVQARRMFGGYGLFCDGVMFGLIADDTLYLKSDQVIEPYFKERNLEQFTYDKRGKPIKMSYFMAPEELFEDPEQATLWARRSLDAALRAKQEPS
ncbi:MAG: TfoX/Sxy family protein [Arenicellales bacterium]|nr:TfoX/Sxy family protein [Arenicellales bacterium]